VAGKAGGGCVRANERESSPVVFDDGILGPPGLFRVTIAAILAHGATVYVFVTAGAALRSETLDITAVVVTHKAGCGRVCAIQGNAGLLFMIEREVFLDGVPIPALVAERTIGGKRVMRHDRAVGFPVPFLLRNE